MDGLKIEKCTHTVVVILYDAKINNVSINIFDYIIIHKQRTVTAFDSEMRCARLSSLTVNKRTFMY